MGKISEVLYKEIEPEVCNLEEAGEFYFHYNLMGISDQLASDYEKYENKQIGIRNKIIGDSLKQGELPRHPKVTSTIFGISSIKDKPVLITEY